MKWIVILSLLIFVSCRDHSSRGLSADQQGLIRLSCDFKSEYKDTSDSRGREKLLVDYEIKLQYYLRHRCSYKLENMHVQLKRFEEDDKGRVYAVFADKENDYVFQKKYGTSAEMKADTIYNLVKSLKRGRDITVRFLFAGNVKVNEPGTASYPGFQIEVTPTAGI